MAIARRFAAFAAAAMLLVGCAPADEEASGKPTVLTTFTVIQDIAQNVAGEHLTVESLTKPGAEIHGYEPTPADIRRATNADLILDNGLNLENWFSQFVEDSDAPHVTVTEGITPIDITEDEGAGLPNPHAWMSPLEVRTYVDNMVAAFSELDPEHATDFERNGENYKNQLQEVHDGMVEELSQLPEKRRALVTCEGAFSYMARDAGLEERFIWAVNSENEATPQQISRAIEFVKENDVPAVFCESTVSDAPMQRVVEATNATYGGTLYVDSLSEEGGPVPTYLDLIKHDADVITKALTGKK